jgi:hypothetical protein
VQCAGANARDIEHVVDKARLDTRIAFDGFETTLEFGLVTFRFLEDRAPAEDHGQRRA